MAFNTAAAAAAALYDYDSVPGDGSCSSLTSSEHQSSSPLAATSAAAAAAVILADYAAVSGVDSSSDDSSCPPAAHSPPSRHSHSPFTDHSTSSFNSFTSCSALLMSPVTQSGSPLPTTATDFSTSSSSGSFLSTAAVTGDGVCDDGEDVRWRHQSDSGVVPGDWSCDTGDGCSCNHHQQQHCCHTATGAHHLHHTVLPDLPELLPVPLSTADEPAAAAAAAGGDSGTAAAAAAAAETEWRMVVTPVELDVELSQSSSNFSDDILFRQDLTLDKEAIARDLLGERHDGTSQSTSSPLSSPPPPPLCSSALSFPVGLVCGSSLCVLPHLTANSSCSAAAAPPQLPAASASTHSHIDPPLSQPPPAAAAAAAAASPPFYHSAVADASAAAPLVTSAPPVSSSFVAATAPPTDARRSCALLCCDPTPLASAAPGAEEASTASSTPTTSSAGDDVTSLLPPHCVTVPLGEQYQACVPPRLSHTAAAAGGDDVLVWRADVLPEQCVRHYLTQCSAAVSSTGAATHSLNHQPLSLSAPLLSKAVPDCESALATLQCHNHNVRLALAARHGCCRSSDRPPTAAPPDGGCLNFSSEELFNFEAGLRLFGKNFGRIRRFKLPNRTVASLVQFYYDWKKRHAARYAQILPKHDRTRRLHTHLNTSHGDSAVNSADVRSAGVSLSSVVQLGPATAAPSPPPPQLVSSVRVVVAAAPSRTTSPAAAQLDSCCSSSTATTTAAAAAAAAAFTGSWCDATQLVMSAEQTSPPTAPSCGPHTPLSCHSFVS